MRRGCAPELIAIAVSVYFINADQKRGRDAGFDMYFAKPVDLTGLQHLPERLHSSAASNGSTEVHSAVSSGRRFISA